MKKLMHVLVYVLIFFLSLFSINNTIAKKLDLDVMPNVDDFSCSPSSCSTGGCNVSWGLECKMRKVVGREGAIGRSYMNRLALYINKERDAIMEQLMEQQKAGLSH